MNDQRPRQAEPETGTVKRQGKGRTGKWIALWPKSIDPKRRNVTPGVTYETQAAAATAMAKQLAACRKDPAAFPTLIQPSGEPTVNPDAFSLAASSRRPRQARDHDNDEDGSVRKLRSGRWRAQWPRRIDPKERNIIPKTQGTAGDRTFATEADARKALRDAIADYRRFPDTFTFHDPETNPEDEGTVATATERFIAENADELAAKTVREYRSIRRAVVCHPTAGIGGKRVRSLTSGELKKWRTSLTEEHGISPAQAAYGWRFLRSVLSWEVENERLTQNPALGQTKRRRKKNAAANAPSSRVQVPSWQQEMDIALNIADEARRLLYLVLLRCVPRFGEAAAIDADLLDAQVNSIPLTHQWVRMTEVFG